MWDRGRRGVCPRERHGQPGHRRPPGLRRGHLGNTRLPRPRPGVSCAECAVSSRLWLSWVGRRELRRRIPTDLRLWPPPQRRARPGRRQWRRLWLTGRWPLHLGPEPTAGPPLTVHGGLYHAHLGRLRAGESIRAPPPGPTRWFRRPRPVPALPGPTGPCSCPLGPAAASRPQLTNLAAACPPPCPEASRPPPAPGPPPGPRPTLARPLARPAWRRLHQVLAALANANGPEPGKARRTTLRRPPLRPVPPAAEPGAAPTTLGTHAPCPPTRPRLPALLACCPAAPCAEPQRSRTSSAALPFRARPTTRIATSGFAATARRCSATLGRHPSAPSAHPYAAYRMPDHTTIRQSQPQSPRPHITPAYIRQTLPPPFLTPSARTPVVPRAPAARPRACHAQDATNA